MPLTPKSSRFIAAYLKSPNATLAAIEAGYSKRTAASQGHRLLRNAEVKRAIAEGQARRAERVEVKSDDALRVLLRNLTFDPASVYDAHGSLLPIHKMPLEARLAVQSIEHGEFGPKLKFWSKDKALELTLRHLGMLKDRVEHSLEKTLEDLVLASMKPEGAK